MSLRLDWCSHEAAKYACEKWHYSRCIPKSKIVKIGVWENEKFIGAIIYGVGATSDLVKRYGLKPTEGCELVRIAMTKHHTPVSRIIAISLKLLKSICPGLRLIVSFADPTHGHHGGVYQASGWIFSGKSQASDEYIYKGKRWQGRSFRNSYKGMEKSSHVTIVKGSSKYRYLMPLDKDMRENIIILSQKYPKRVVSSDSAALGFQPGEGGANPTTTLQTT
jgi:hypothetical protein